MGEANRSEDEHGRKWDRCLSDTAIKVAGGVGLGIVFSVAFFRRRPWPVTFGTGIGLGMGYANCQHDFMSPNLFHGLVRQVEAKKKMDLPKTETVSKKEEPKKAES